MMVYDVTNIESFKNLDDWLAKIKEYAKPSARIYLIGNKIDLISFRQVSSLDHDKFVSDNKLTGGLFVSAKTGENVVKTFYKIASEAIGIKLTDYELGFHDKVLSAQVLKTSDKDEDRNPWADEIEREDMELERRKKTSENKKDKTCVCN